MIYVFTYHKVRDNNGQGETDFYTVTPAQLDRQIEMLKARGRKPLNAQKLLENVMPEDGGYLLTFDDGTADHFDVVLPVLEKHGCQGVFFIPTSKLNKEGYLTNAQVQKMAASGQVIGFHGHDHKRLDVMPKEEVRRQIAVSQKIIGDIVGAKPVIFSPPGGFMSPQLYQAALNEGVKVIRTMRWGYNRELDLTALETIPLNRYTTEKKFVNILEKQNSQWLYTAKETLKRLLPLRSYERLRSMLFKLSKSE